MNAPSLDPRCQLSDDVLRDINTPALVVFPELIREHLVASIDRAGGAGRLRPHVKTHKTTEIVRMAVARGVAKHKAATIAEAELLAQSGAADVLIAFPLVGPSQRRLASLVDAFPGVRWSTLVDHKDPARELDRVIGAAQQTLDVFVDVDVGMGRTGCLPSHVGELVKEITNSRSLRYRGLHAYDGHVHQADPRQRSDQVDAIDQMLRRVIEQLDGEGYSTSAIVAGGSPTFPHWSRKGQREPRVETSPGTFFLNDWNYFKKYEDLPFSPAALLLGRVVSKPGDHRLTIDLGHKALAPDSPMEERARLLNVPEAVIVRHNEEHLVVETPAAARFPHGAVIQAWPAHICPTVALYSELIAMEAGRPVGVWQVRARDRKLSY